MAVLHIDSSHFNSDILRCPDILNVVIGLQNTATSPANPRSHGYLSQRQPVKPWQSKRVYWGFYPLLSAY